MTDLDKALEPWRSFSPKLGGENFIAGDKDFIDRLRRMNRVAEHFGGWKAFHDRGPFGVDDKRLHLELTPIPFLGNVETAAAVVLFQNPGLSPCDYFAEYERPEFRAKLIRNLRGHGCGGDYPFLFLDPANAWHAGFAWWQSKFRFPIEALARKLAPEVLRDTKVSSWPKDEAARILRSARQVLARHVAAIELLPYHSATGTVPDGILKEMASTKIARSIVIARGREAEPPPIVLTRQAKQWNLQDCGLESLHRYETKLARSSSLRPKDDAEPSEIVGGNLIVNAVWKAHKAAGA